MQAVAGIVPVEYIGQWRGRRRNIALRQQKGRFVMVGQEAAAGRVALAEYDMPGDSEAGGPPGVEERIYTVPAIEAHGEATGLELARHLGEGGPEPVEAVVVRDRPPAAVSIPDAVGRVGQDVVFACCWLVLFLFFV